MTPSIRPVFVRRPGGSEPNSEVVDDTATVIFHDGLRWAMSQITQLTTGLGKNPSDEELVDFFKTFHTIDYSLDFVPIFSTAVQTASPEDAEMWMQDGMLINLRLECTEIDPGAAEFIAGDSKDFFGGGDEIVEFEIPEGALGGGPGGGTSMNMDNRYGYGY